MAKQYTIKDLLDSLENPTIPTLENTASVWSRIGGKDSFEELGLEPDELEKFLEEWIADNDYSNI